MKRIVVLAKQANVIGENEDKLPLAVRILAQNIVLDCAYIADQPVDEEDAATSTGDRILKMYGINSVE